MIDLFHGKELQQLELADVEALLDDPGAERLHWEAKGVAIKSGEVRQQICGFANSHNGGFLILGADVRDGKWVLDGVKFPGGDPPNWISSVAGAGGVQPYPEGLDSRPIKPPNGNWIVVVWIPLTPTPPCNTHGTVYERVSGRTISVREPLRLAEHSRGDTAAAAAGLRAKATRTIGPRIRGSGARTPTTVSARHPPTVSSPRPPKGASTSPASTRRSSSRGSSGARSQPANALRASFCTSSAPVGNSAAARLPPAR